MRQSPASLPAALSAGFLSLILTTAPALAVEQTPTDSVKSTIGELIQILGNQDLNDPGRSEERRRQIEHMLRDRVSYQDMARRSLGRPWADLSEAERQEFVELFIQFLAKSLSGWKLDSDPQGNRIREYADELVTYVAEHRDERFSEVKTKLRSLKVDTQVDFLLVNHSGHWRVYDVVVDHVSIAGNYRSQFANISRLISLSELEDQIKKTMPILKLFEIMTPQ